MKRFAVCGAIWYAAKRQGVYNVAASTNRRRFAICRAAEGVYNKRALQYQWSHNRSHHILRNCSHSFKKLINFHNISKKHYTMIKFMFNRAQNFIR